MRKYIVWCMLTVLTVTGCSLVRTNPPLRRPLVDVVRLDAIRWAIRVEDRIVCVGDSVTVWETYWETDF